MGVGARLIRRLRPRRDTALPPDFSDTEARVWRSVEPYTMTSPERIKAVCDACLYIGRAAIPGAVVECGVWRGGAMMAAAITLREAGDVRDLYLFDTFAGMTDPEEVDVRYDGEPAAAMQRAGWCAASVDEVRRSMDSTGYPSDRVHLVEGDVLETIPSRAPDTIALLRLDTDWYRSTRHELDHLWSRVSPGGILLLDDYGHWQGQREAVDAFFEGAVFLARTDYTGRAVVKR